jgi:hypothetical protein
MGERKRLIEALESSRWPEFMVIDLRLEKRDRASS